MIAIEQKAGLHDIFKNPGFAYQLYPRTENPLSELAFDNGQKAIYLGVEQETQEDKYFLYDPRLVEVMNQPIEDRTPEEVDSLIEEVTGARYAVVPNETDRIVAYRPRALAELLRMVK